MYIEDEQEREVSGILKQKGSGAKKKYLAAYSGCSESKAYWLPEIELFNALEILNDYKVSHSLS